MWMNEMEIDEARERFAAHPLLGKAARFLAAFRDEVNAHSDGWAYWKLPAQAAEKLMTFLQGHLYAGMGAYPRLPEPTEADLRKAITPIKAFYTRRGYAAGMQMPTLDKPKPQTIQHPVSVAEAARLLGTTENEVLACLKLIRKKLIRKKGR